MRDGIEHETGVRAGAEREPLRRPARRPGARVTSRRASVAVGLVGALLLGLAGCTGGSAAGPDVSAPPTAEPTPTPTLEPPVTEPAKPDAWADSGADGAAAAAVWFLSDEYRYVIETNDTAEWERLSHPECVFCASVATDAAERAEGGWTSRQSKPNRLIVTRVEELNPLAYSVLVDIDTTAIRITDTSGALVRESVAANGQMLFNVHREGPDWQLRGAQWFEADADVPSALAAP